MLSFKHASNIVFPPSERLFWFLGKLSEHLLAAAWTTCRRAWHPKSISHRPHFILMVKLLQVQFFPTSPEVCNTSETHSRVTCESLLQNNTELAAMIFRNSLKFERWGSTHGPFSKKAVAEILLSNNTWDDGMLQLSSLVLSQWKELWNSGFK